jgi:hypothetical protein
MMRQSPGFAPVPPHLRLVEVLDLAGVTAAADDAGGTYLVVAVPGQAGPRWWCAPATERALDCVRSRRAAPWAVLHHSATGTVQLWEADGDGCLAESVRLCADLPDGPDELVAA